MIRRWARRGVVIVAWLFVAGVVGQVFLAGLGVFGVPAGDFSTHRGFGYLVGWLTLVILVLAIAGRLPRRVIGLAVLLLILFALQSVFVAIRDEYPAVAALHPLNGFLILLVGIVIARDARASIGASVAA
ncbi:MAG: hypothetical protein XU10_C0023G0008 [Chloroflexi bacterium CSP1-4]|nr:MAG: hypothetical protein XU10_C0023G0008 [Chloroflexi bacterium CSP1-4]